MPQIQKEKKMWFKVPDDPLKGRVEIRHLKDGEVQEVYNKVTETQTSFVDGESVTSVKQSTNARVELAVKAVTDWENHTGEDGKPLKCTPKNVRLFAVEDNFLLFIGECRKELSKSVEKERLAKEKN